MRVSITKGRRQYSSIIATEGHTPLSSISQFGRYASYQMGLTLRNTEIGSGFLQRWRGANRRHKFYLQTESTGLNRGFRKKGHGIILYICLIESARALGARRIYSSKTLNRYSRRMWEEKLGRFYKVGTYQIRCGECGCKRHKEPRFFIDLQGPKPNGLLIS